MISFLYEITHSLCNFFFLVGSGSLRAKFDLSEGPSKPTTLAVQFLSEGSTLSGVDIELVGTGYRLSLVKKRFATGKLGYSEFPNMPGKLLYYETKLLSSCL